MKKTRENIKREYTRACLDYLYQLLEDWGFYGEDYENGNFGWWVGDEVGGVFCFEDDTFINMNDIKYCVDNGVDYDDYQEYQEYNARCVDFGFNTMNLNAFIKGAPRISNEEFENLEEIKQSLQDAIDNIKDKFDF